MATQLDDNIKQTLDENILLKLALSQINLSSPIVYSHLKPKQAECARQSVSGCDQLVLLPTGYGKSLLFQLLPTYNTLLREFKDQAPCNIKSIIIAPLNAIIEQQQHRLKDALVIRQKDSLIEAEEQDNSSTEDDDSSDTNDTSTLSSQMKKGLVHDMAQEGGKLKMLFATEAFSMGFDSHDITQVIHAGVPSTLETYLQEVGRAGRNGQPSNAHMYYNNDDIGGRHISPDMAQYCKLQSCRRAYLCQHFGCDIAEQSAGHMCCDNCAKDCCCEQCTSVDNIAETTCISERPVAHDLSVESDVFHSLCALFKHWNNMYQKDTPIDAALLTGLTPSLAQSIAKNYEHLSDFDVLSVAYKHIDKSVLALVMQTINACT